MSQQYCNHCGECLYCDPNHNDDEFCDHEPRTYPHGEPNALVAAAAEVTALWARYAWHDTATFAEFEDAVARLDALLPEGKG